MTDAEEFNLDTAPDHYVGNPDLRLFDIMIGLAGEVNGRAAVASRGRDLTSIERAATEIAPGAFSLVFSIRHLIRGGYLFAAEALVRCLLERVLVLSYLRKQGDSALDLWERGWPHKSRPSLKQMLRFLDDPGRSQPGHLYPPDYSIADTLSQQIDFLNRIIHADPMGAARNAVFVPELKGNFYLAGPNFRNPSYCSEVSMLGMGLTACLVHELGEIFPEIKPSTRPEG